jgi:hypothetical protein
VWSTLSPVVLKVGIASLAAGSAIPHIGVTVGIKEVLLNILLLYLLVGGP